MAAAASSIARTSTILRSLCKATTTKTINISHSVVSPKTSSVRSNLIFPEQIRISTPARLRREALFLSSLQPIHSAIASACLISKLPSEVSTSTDVSQAIVSMRTTTQNFTPTNYCSLP